MIDRAAGVRTPRASGPGDPVAGRRRHIERDVIARGVFTSVTDLRRKQMRYIKQCGEGVGEAG